MCQIIYYNLIYYNLSAGQSRNFVEKKEEEKRRKCGRKEGREGSVNRWLGGFESGRVSRRARRDATRPSSHARWQGTARSRFAPGDRYVSPTSCFCDYATHLLGSCAPPLPSSSCRYCCCSYSFFFVLIGRH